MVKGLPSMNQLPCWDESLLTGGGVDRVEVAWTVVGKEGGKRNGLRGGDEVVRLREGSAEERHVVEGGDKKRLMDKVGVVGAQRGGKEVQVALAERGLGKETVAVEQSDDLAGDGAARLLERVVASGRGHLHLVAEGAENP